ncbi:MAG: ABC transporter ATP-binding protein, partial [Gammaproteobacteria bacterium]|nr:ABC transporter ATP-binding protein [Gammaproteobacteria bacterium]
MKTTFSIADKAPNLPRTPWRFALHFYSKIKFALIAIFAFEAGQASCTIMLPYALKDIIDAAQFAKNNGGDVFEATNDAIVFFAVLNIGIVLFSRASG